ncbi:MAG: fatty acid CoA ligase family protein [Chloroflexaceae bacterium]|nr:fatty acid CoA ligase family protein [Chloroflexaceae bacterium]
MIAEETPIVDLKPLLENWNIARHLPEVARQHPEQVAVVTTTGHDWRRRPIYERLSFAELDRLSDAYAWGLQGYGIGRGMRVLLMVRPGLPLIGLTFALFKAGCIPILIDPAMGRQNLITCIEEVTPEAMVGIERAHIARKLFPKAFRSVKRAVTVGKRLFWGGPTLDELKVAITTPFPMEQMTTTDPAAIIFTTGSTGLPKGVQYEHGMFNAQVDMLREQFNMQPGEVDMPAFPLFALFNAALGITSAIPPIDPTRPASCNPAEVLRFMHDQGVTTTFGSPAIWNKVTAYMVKNNVTVPTLRRVLMAGAPVPLHIHERFRGLLPPDADTHTPYGATEALPITSISGRQVTAAMNERNDPMAGTCVGWPMPGVTLRIIPIVDESIPTWDESLVRHPYEVGEIVVKGPAVTKQYINRPQANAIAKIREGEATWHRMGDLGYLDAEGRVWFYGRKTHRVPTAEGCLYTEPCELVFNQHRDVFRSALVGVPEAGNDQAKRPVIVIEPKPGTMPKTAEARERFIGELRRLGAAHEMTAGISTFLFHPAFPVDIRHNAKIFREKLALWAAKEL